MKLNNIKTEEDFNTIGDNWYQRTHRLRLVWQDDSETEERKTKSYLLWVRMYERLTVLVSLYTKLSQVKTPTFEQGGVISNSFVLEDEIITFTRKPKL